MRPSAAQLSDRSLCLSGALSTYPTLVRNICSIEDCPKFCFGHGLCQAHYLRQRRHGSPFIVHQHGYRPARPSLDRYLENIAPPNENGCRLWLGSVNDDGYGTFTIGSRTTGDRKTLSAHRFGYKHLVGPIPPGLSVCHTCDIRPCQEPSHWFLGTQATNIADMIAKGRAVPLVGIRNGRAKLTEDDVRLIRQLLATGLYTRKQLSEQFGVAPPQITRLRKQESWRNVT